LYSTQSIERVLGYDDSKQTNHIKEEKTFRIIDYGMHVIKLYDEMDKLLVYSPIRLWS